MSSAPYIRRQLATVQQPHKDGLPSMVCPWLQPKNALVSTGTLSPAEYSHLLLPLLTGALSLVTSSFFLHSTSILQLQKTEDCTGVLSMVDKILFLHRKDCKEVLLSAMHSLSQLLQQHARVFCPFSRTTRSAQGSYDNKPLLLLSSGT